MTIVEAIIAVGGGCFCFAVILLLNHLIAELRLLRNVFEKFQVHHSQRMTAVETRLENLVKLGVSNG